jgi:hypothetical protein
MWEDTVVKNFTSTFNSHAMHIETIMTNSTYFAPNTASLNNNATFDALSDTCSVPESFYLKYFPREVFIYALLSPLAYYWQIYLERFFPTRSRGVVVDYEKKEKVEVDVNEDQEGEVVKRWIAQGRVRGSSVSWWNTFVKWALDMTFARFFFAFLGNLIESFVKWESWKTIRENIFWVRRNFHNLLLLIPLNTRALPGAVLYLKIGADLRDSRTHLPCSSIHS